ncbi:MAG: dTMP kinase [Gemmatimonadetes bacterium]|nr:dTMP kinase [Gemmatimonadota bacterium]
MKDGLFLVLEGVEGAGKTTQARLLANWIGRLGLPVTSTREPGGTAVGEAVRSVLLDHAELEMSAETELLLVLAARAAFVRQVVRPALEKGGVLLADRFSLSTLAYQGYGRGLDLERVRTLDAFARGGLAPDLTLVLELAPEEGARRQRAAGKGRDRMERAGEEFHTRVSDGYRELAAGSDARVRAVDALGTPDAVQDRVRMALHEVFPGTFQLSRD